jgi:signal transduction histidine kinase
LTAVFSLLLILGGWAGLVGISLLDYRREIDRIQSENAFAALAFEEHARRVLKEADTALLFMKDEFEKTGSVSESMKDFGRRTKEDLQAIQVGVSDAAGNLLFSAFPYKTPLNIFPREHFQAQLRRSDAGFYIAKPIKSRATGDWVIFLSRRINRADGSFAGIVSIGLDPFSFGKVYGNLGVGQGRTGMLVGKDDHVVRVRMSFNERWVGDDIGGFSPVFKAAAGKPAGFYEVVTAPGRIARMASYRVMPEYPLIVTASVIKSRALAGWKIRTLANAFATFLFSLFVSLFGYYLVRALRLVAQGREAMQALQERLVQSQKIEAIGTLAGGVAHDFNNMLGVILGHTELVLAQVDPNAPFRHNLEEINKAAQRSADVTRQLLAFARKQTVAPKVLDLNESLESVLRMIRSLIGEDIKLSWKPGRNLWKVKIDPSQVDQLMANLATNARDAISGIGEIAIETSNATIDQQYCSGHPGSLPGAYVVLSVSDDGCGIPHDKIDHIFDPFFTTKEQGKGTGLGLATVFGIVKQNGGYINVYSEPGRGTTFTIYLPRAEAGRDGVPDESTPQPELHGGAETILVVEDEESNLNLVTQMLESFGYRVLAANSPSGAIRLFKANGGSIDLLVTDVIMPEMDGRKLRDILAGDQPGLKTLYMSGYTASVITDRGVLDEGVNFIQKPFTRRDLVTKVREALD